MDSHVTCNIICSIIDLFLSEAEIRDLAGELELHYYFVNHIPNRLYSFSLNFVPKSYQFLRNTDIGVMESVNILYFSQSMEITHLALLSFDSSSHIFSNIRKNSQASQIGLKRIMGSYFQVIC